MQAKSRCNFFCSSDGTIKVWDLQKAVCQETLRADPKGVWALAPYNEHQFFAGGEEESVVRLWDLRRVERCIGALRLDLGTITTLCPMGLYLGVGGTRRQIHVIDLNQLTAVSTVSLDNKYPTCLTTFAGKLAVGCNTGTLELYSLQIPGGPSPLIAQPHVSICFRCPVPPPYCNDPRKLDRKMS
jgi:WD40 repeat protein